MYPIFTVVDECKRNCTGKNCDMKYIRDDSATCTLGKFTSVYSRAHYWTFTLALDT